MSRLLVVSATPFEIEPLLAFLKDYRQNKKQQFLLNSARVEVLVTGVGMVKTAFELAQKRDEPYSALINAGVAGSFFKFRNGDVVRVEEDCFSELGAEDGEGFLSIDDLQLGSQHVKLQQVYRTSAALQLPLAKGITVNTVHGNESSIRKMVQRLDPDIETMESAAFIHACNAFGWQGLVLRGISNQVERRNRDHWEMKLAIENLNRDLISVIKEFSGIVK